MNNIRNNIKRDFTTIPNALINDNTLTDRARFLFCYMAAKPDDWKFYQSKISYDLNLSIETIRKYISELESSGWLSRELVRSEGKFDSYDYTLNASPCGKNTDKVKNHDGEKPTRENLVLTNEIPLQKNTVNNKEENKVVESYSTVLIDDDEDLILEIHHVPEWFEHWYEQKSKELQKEYLLVAKTDGEVQVVLEKMVELDQKLEAFQKEKQNPTPQVAPSPPPRKKREKKLPDNPDMFPFSPTPQPDPTPINAMWEKYAAAYSVLNKGEEPVFHKKYLRSLKTLYAILHARTVKKGIVPLDNVQPWGDFLDMVVKFLRDNPKEVYLRGRFDPIGLEAEFNKIVGMLVTGKGETSAEKWARFAQENGLH